ncbi:MAG: alanine racemase [Paenibacillaceae bacterium]
MEKLTADAEVTVALDSVEVARDISEVGRRLGRSMSLYIDVDSGLQRCGRGPGEETLQIVAEIVKLPFVCVTGLMTHAGHSYKADSKHEQVRISRLEGIVPMGVFNSRRRARGDRSAAHHQDLKNPVYSREKNPLGS